MNSIQKLGLILSPSKDLWWSQSYASVPTPIILNDKIRVYYATRCHENKSRVTFIDFDINNPTKIIEKYDKICLDVGEHGQFDCDGVQPTKVICIRGNYYMYYAGYRNILDGYYDLFTGIAVSKDGNKFTKIKETPILDRIPGETNIRVGTTVTYNNYYQFFYIADAGWFEMPGGKKSPKYKMMFGISPWHDKLLSQESVMEPEGDEIGFSRPWLNGNELYYAVRKYENENNPYVHIEKAKFENDRLVRTKEIILERSDSENMLCFPAVLDLPGGKFIWYNGNNYGQDGILLAKLC